MFPNLKFQVLKNQINVLRSRVEVRNGVISWISKKHSCTNLLTMKVEFITYLTAI